VVIFGGATYEGGFNDVLSFDVRAEQWTRHNSVGASPSPRYLHGACRVADSMFVFGGYSEIGLLNDRWQFTLDTRS